MCSHAVTSGLVISPKMQSPHGEGRCRAGFEKGASSQSRTAGACVHGSVFIKGLPASREHPGASRSALLDPGPGTYGRSVRTGELGGQQGSPLLSSASRPRWTGPQRPEVPPDPAPFPVEPGLASTVPSGRLRGSRHRKVPALPTPGLGHCPSSTDTARADGRAPWGRREPRCPAGAGASDFCSEFLRSECFTYGLLTDSFTGKLKIPLNN